MKANYYIESMPFCEVFDKYIMKLFEDDFYILPDKNATKKQIPAEKAKDAMIEFLNIGRKYYYCDEINNAELMGFFEKYGLLGFMDDFSANKYYTVCDDVVLRCCNLITKKDAVMKVNLLEYMQIFFPRLKESQIIKKIKECNKILSEPETEVIMNYELNKHLIFSEEYGEPLKMITDYAQILYGALRATTIEDEYQRINPIISMNGLGNHISRVPTEMGVRFNTLKQGIDYNFLMNITQDIPTLKACKYCGRAFIASNPKAEYDTPSCKNKANVYKSRGKILGKNMIFRDDGTIATRRIMPSEELSQYFVDAFTKKRK